MRRTRLTTAALLALGVLASACITSKQQNGQECLKDGDCESDRCVQYVCFDPNASKLAADSGSATTDATEETATDAATDVGEETAPDTATSADTETPDTATPADAGGD